VIFGDYDVDGVSSTALLYTFFDSIGIECSYRLPHRVQDGYGLKKYHFDELAKKSVKLVVTVDCGTRDIEPIRHAKSLGIDVIVTDHHAVPDIIPEEVVAIVNPKRKDSKYPFPNLAGAGVAFKLIHAIAIKLKLDLDETLTQYIDMASLGTVADCMPLIGENRIITALGLRQMKQSKSSALRKYIENLDRDIEGDADIIGFQIGPRINAAGRMDSPLKALHWLLATEDKVDDWLLEVESLNVKRQETVKNFSEEALLSVDIDAPILFYIHDELEHGLIGLVAGKLTEAYGKPSIVLCPHNREDK
jgi:single-stranded-DNA-specific exonuclease